MQHLTWSRLALIAAGAAVLAWAITRTALGSGYTPLPVPCSVAAVAVAAAAAALVVAWPVRQYQHGRRPGLDGLRAARAAGLALATAYAGSILAGSFGGYALGLAPEWGHAPRREVALSALVAAAGGVVMVVCGWIAEHWCRTQGPGDGQGQARGPAPRVEPGTAHRGAAHIHAADHGASRHMAGHLVSQRGGTLAP